MHILLAPAWGSTMVEYNVEYNGVDGERVWSAVWDGLGMGCVVESILFRSGQ